MTSGAAELRADRLERVAAELARTRTEEDVAHVAVEAARAAFGAPLGTLVVERDGRLMLLATAGYSETFDERFAAYPPDVDLPVPQAARTGETVAYGSPEDGRARFSALAALPEAAAALACAPLLVEGRSVGVLAIGFREPHAFAGDELELLEGVAALCAQALERARLDEEARVTAAQLELVLRTAPFGFCFLDREMRFVRVNDALAAINGRPAAEHIGRRPDEVVPTLPADLLRATFEQVLGGAAPPGLEFEAETPAAPGVPRSFLENWYPLRDPATGEVTGAAVMVVETTESKRLQAERLLSEERGQAARVLAAVGDGVALVADDGVVRAWNPAAEAIAGVAAADAIGRPLAATLVGWESAAASVPVSASGGIARPVTVPVESGGAERWLSVSAVATDRGTVLAFRDVTEERLVEQLKSDFIATVSHELRTPLSAVYGAAMTLRHAARLDDATREELLDVIDEQAGRLSRIIGEILTAGRLESGTLALGSDPVDLVAVAEAAGAEARAASGRRIDVTHDRPVRVRGDEGRLRQVVANLLDNALKYSPADEPVDVLVRTAARRARVEVRDRGIGIPAADRERIFEKFVRLDPELTRGVGGTGLGLYVCREIVRRLDGRILVDSVEGVGSSFTVELPLAEA